VGRVRIADVAQRAGVSKGAASFALNGRPGVSAETRERVLRIAADMGWRPNTAARALAGGRSDTIGLVLNRPPHVRGVEPLLQHYLEGMQDELVDHAITLSMQVVSGHAAELATYEQWSSANGVDGLVVIDLRVDDDRPAALQELGLPAVTLGDPRYAAGLPTVWTDDAAAARELVAALVALGHRRLARVTSGSRLAYSRVRTDALAAAAAAAGLAEPEVLQAEGRSVAAPEATRRLLDRPAADRPTAVVYENDLQAMAGTGVAAELGLDVPGDVSVVAWDSSGISRLTRPTLSVMRRDARAEAAGAVRMLLERVGGAAVEAVQAPTARLEVRGSTGPAPAGG
jgi:DNA-binding LacI/PurR family transcriptional regulator